MQMVPSLAQVGRTNDRPVQQPRYVAHPETGLLYVQETEIPVIEQLLEEPGGALSRALETVITKADADPFDPDLIRAGRREMLMQLETQLQRAIPDPDVIRACQTRFETLNEPEA